MKKTESLRTNYMFRRVYSKGRTVAGKYMVLYALKNGREINRLGVTASGKVGKSVKRNRIRRIIKESYRHLEDEMSTGYDMAFVARVADTLPGYREVLKEMGYLLRKAGVIRRENRE